MEIVKTLRRMLALRDGIKRCPVTDDRYDDVLDALEDKYDELHKTLRVYRVCSDKTNREERIKAHYRRKAVDLACRYLNIDWYRL